jgi:hypothetical protein
MERQTRCVIRFSTFLTIFCSAYQLGMVAQVVTSPTFQKELCDAKEKPTT